MFILFTVLMVQGTFAQKKAKTETIVVQTSAECGQCKDRLEEMLNYTSGVKFSELDLTTMKLTIKFSPSKISSDDIKKKISELGYDADEVKANPEAQKKLPACCQPGGMKHH